MVSRFRVLVLVLALAIAAVSATPTFAAKGGNGGGHNGGSTPTGTATLTLTPNPAAPYSVVQVSGCGYTVGAPTEIGFITPTSSSVGSVFLNSSGCFATSLYVYGPGSYTVQILQDPSGSWSLKASSSLSVQ